MSIIVIIISGGFMLFLTTSGRLKFCAVCSWKPSESEAQCTRPRINIKAPNCPVRIIPAHRTKPRR